MDARAWFDSAADGLLDVLPGLGGRLDDPGLGDWSVRSLLGHTCRAFITVETYLADAEPHASTPPLPSPEAYFHAAAGSLGDPAEVRRRGEDAGRALGDDPLSAAARIAARVRPIVAAVDDARIIATPVGAMRLADYLPTRAFELTVHGLDLAAATDQTPPSGLLHVIPEALALSARIAEAGQALSLLRAATGRGALPAGFSVL